MAVPGICGLLINIFNHFFFEDTSKSPLNAAFSIGMSFWAIMFSVNWNRAQRCLKVMWDNMYFTETDIEMIRSDFVGEPSINPITEKVEPHFSVHARYLRYLQSFIVILPCFIGVFFFLVVWYNLTGVITADGDHKDFYIKDLAVLAEKDAIFDPDSNMGFVVSIA
jgi:hypothetical protein